MVTVSDKRVQVQADTDNPKTVKHLAGDTLYYGGSNVSPTTNDGWLTSGQSQELTQARWFVSAGQSNVSEKATERSAVLAATTRPIDTRLDALEAEWPGTEAALDARLDLVEDAVEGVLTETDGTLVGASRPFLNALTFAGVVNDGVTNSTAGLRAAVDTGAYVYVPEGRYYVTGTLHDPGDTTATVKIIGAGPERTVFIQGADQRIVNRTNSFGAAIDVAADAAAGDTELELDPGGVDAGDLEVGDYIVVKNDNTVPGPKGAIEGEVARIKEIAGDTITLYGQLEFGYLTADSSTVEKMTLAEGIVLCEFSVENPEPGSGKVISGIFKLAFTLRARVADVWFVGLDQTAIELRNAVDAQVDRTRYLDLTNDAGASLFGYGVLFFEAAVGCRVTGISMRGGRHAVTAGSAAGLIVPAHCKVADGQACEMTSAAWDTHEEGRDITFSDVHAWNCPLAFSSRAPRTHYSNVTARRCDKAWEGSDVATGSSLSGGRFTDMEGDSGTTLACIRLIGVDQRVDDVEIDGCMNEGVVSTDNADRARVTNVRVRDPGRSGARDTCFSIGSGDWQVWDGLDSADAAEGIETTANAQNLTLGRHSFENVTTTYTLDPATTWAVPPILHGPGSPEGLVAAPPGAIWRNTETGSSRATVFFKNTGTDVTGWGSNTDRANVNSADAGVTLSVAASKRRQLFTATLTATRTITLSATGVIEGSTFHITREGAGAFNLSVGGLKNLAQNEWCEVTYFAGTVNAWKLTKFGSL